MAIVFIHGVNTRDTDRDYQQAMGARRVLFNRLVAKVLPQDRYASFKAVEDVYWGDLGVQFGWNLRSIPVTRTLESLGAEGSPVIDNLDLVLLLTQPKASRPQTGESRVEALGASSGGLLANAAATNPARVVRAIFAPEAARFDPTTPAPPATQLSEEAKAAAQNEGEQLAIMLLAADKLAQDVQSSPQLIAGEDDAEVFKKVRDETNLRYQQLAAELQGGSVSHVEGLGVFDDATRWARQRLESLVKGAKSAVRATADFIKGAGEETARGGSLLLLQALRDEASQKGLRFFGDVLVYLRRGHPPKGDIQQRVRDGIRNIAARKNADGSREPLVIITHSFGSIILHDLLTAGELDDIKVDLWVTVGAQTSLFAEMRLYESSPKDVPSAGRSVLGKPTQVTRWINFYDAADVLSYLHEPVFGSDSVTDIQVRDRANIKNAHGHYFITPDFYERVGEELKSLFEKNQLV
jgi:hypothetical protein